MTISSIWASAQEEIKNRLGSTSYETWFSSLQVIEKDAQTLIIETPDEFFKNWIVDHYHSFLLEIFEKLLGRTVTIEFSVNSQMEKAPSSSPEKPWPNQSVDPSFEKPKRSLRIDSRFTFDNFVIGPSNRFACAAGLAVAESPSKAYNPLFIYGQVGLGKTHLIQAITHKINELNPSLRISYLSSEHFTNALINSIRTRSTEEFRKKYREIDVLLIDDIHFIAGKESTQEEFFHTFNYLHQNKKQIIITSDRPPREITKLEERLSSRFAWGLITDIQPPDFETRVAILRKKVELESALIPNDVINFIAEQIKTNIRELEGALIRVNAYALLEGTPISLEMAKMVLKDMVKESTKIISVEMVQKAVSEFFQVSLNDLRAKRRNRNIVYPRQMAMFLTRKLTNLSLPEIGNAFGGKDHTTVLHSCKKIEKESQENRDTKRILEEITTALQR